MMDAGLRRHDEWFYFEIRINVEFIPDSSRSKSGLIFSGSLSLRPVRALSYSDSFDIITK
jgi:hypothetical protein